MAYCCAACCNRRCTSEASTTAFGTTKRSMSAWGHGKQVYQCWTTWQLLSLLDVHQRPRQCGPTENTVSIDTASHLYVTFPPRCRCRHSAGRGAQRILKIEGNIWYEGGLRNLSKQLFPAPKFCPSWYYTACNQDSWNNFPPPNPDCSPSPLTILRVAHLLSQDFWALLWGELGMNRAGTGEGVAVRWVKVT